MPKINVNDYEVEESRPQSRRVKMNNWKVKKMK